MVCAESVRAAGHRGLLRSRYQKFMPTIFAVHDRRKSVIDHRESLSARYQGASLPSCIESRVRAVATNRPIGPSRADRTDTGVTREWAALRCTKGGGGAVNGVPTLPYPVILAV